MIEAKNARKNLTYLWYIGSALILLIYIFQQINGKFEHRTMDAWKWISANIFPFVSLVSSTFILDMKKGPKKFVDQSYYSLSFFSSLFYLVILFLVILLYPFSNQPIIDYYHSQDVFLIPIQALISGVIGIFFVKGNEVR